MSRALRRALLAAALVVLAGPPAFAASGWFATATCENALTAPRLQVGTPVYFCIDSGTTLNSFSAVVLTQGLRMFTIERHGDRTQSGAGACAVEPYRINAKAGAAVSSSTGLSMISADTDNDGVQNDLSLNGAASRRMLYGVVAFGVTLKATAIAAGSEQCVIAFTAGY